MVHFWTAESDQSLPLALVMPVTAISLTQEPPAFFAHTSTSKVSAPEL